MRQHVNPLSKYFQEIDSIPKIDQIFKNSVLPTHLDIGCASGEFLFQLAEYNKNWNYLGVEIREKLIIKAKNKLKEKNIDNLYFIFGNADNLLKNWVVQYPDRILESASIYFPDPWFKKKHHKRRIIQPQLIQKISHLMVNGGYISIKSDVEELFKYMDITIIKSKFFITYIYQDREIFNSYNPIDLKTNREKYILTNKQKVFEKLYKKI